MIVAELSSFGDRVELPKHFPRVHVVGARKSFGVVMRLRLRAFFHGRANDHNVLHHCGSRVQAELARFQVNLFVDSGERAHFHIDDAMRAKPLDRIASLGIQLD